MNRQKFIKNIAVISFSALILGTAGHSEAVTYSSAFPDGKAIGPTRSEFSTPIKIADTNLIVHDIMVTIDLQHSKAGDVVIDLIGPDQRLLNLIQLPNADDKDQFAKGNMYAFSDHGLTLLPEWNTGTTLPGGLYQPKADNIGTNYNDSFADWAGMKALGTWQLRVADKNDGTKINPGETWYGGFLYSWELNINPTITTGEPPSEVPIPGALWLFGSAVASILGLRKKSRQS